MWDMLYWTMLAALCFVGLVLEIQKIKDDINTKIEIDGTDIFYAIICFIGGITFFIIGMP